MRAYLIIILIAFSSRVFSEESDPLLYDKAISLMLDKHDNSAISLLKKSKPGDKYYQESKLLLERILCRKNNTDCNTEGFRLNIHVSYLSTADFFLDRNNDKHVNKRLYWLNKSHNLARRNFDVYTARNTAYRIALIYNMTKSHYDEEKAIKYYSIASESGHLEATTNLGILYYIQYQRDGIENKLNISKKLLSRSCNSNDKPACIVINSINGSI